MQDWEVSLLANTRALVRQALPEILPKDREPIVVDIYLAMHDTLKLFHKKSTPPPTVLPF